VESRFYNTLDFIRKRPSMYQVYSLKNLADIICGITTASILYDIDFHDKGYKEFMEDFYEFILSYFNEKSTGGWWRVIQSHTNSDKEALILFFELLEKFKNRNTIVNMTAKSAFI
jgi:hypothetical protein